ncbi:hypothetical protein EMIT0P228_10571 [Pseudomonas brassicacearum]
MHRRGGEFERRHQAVPQQYPCQEQPRGQVTHAHRLARESQQWTAQVPTAIGGHQQHFEAVIRLARVGQVLDQHRLRSTSQQRPGHGQAVEQRLRLASRKTVQFQLVRAHEVRHGGGFFQEKLTHLGRHDAAFLWMSHDRITQVQRLRIGGLDPRHARQNRPPLGRATQVTGQHRIAVTQLTDGRNAFYQYRYLLWGQHFTGPLAVLGVIGKLHGVERPNVHANPLHRKHCGAIAGVSEYHVGLNGKQMRRTFHAGSFRKTIEIQAAQYATKRSLYDRPARQLSWQQLVGALRSC